MTREWWTAEELTPASSRTPVLPMRGLSTPGPHLMRGWLSTRGLRSTLELSAMLAMHSMQAPMEMSGAC